MRGYSLSKASKKTGRLKLGLTTKTSFIPEVADLIPSSIFESSAIMAGPSQDGPCDPVVMEAVAYTSN